VPEGPVRDALAAVDIGQNSEPKAADWPRIRSGLEKLLEKPKDENKRQNQQQNQSKQDQDKQDQDKQEQNSQQGQRQNEAQGSPPPSGRPDSSQEPRQRQNQPQSGQPKGQSAFGDMQNPPTPPPQGKPEGPMQKVGGLKKDEPNDPARANPELAIPLEKLERLRSQDSPAELFELLRRGEPMPPVTNTGKNW
jgi:Ca-activated chloride channel family protein